MEIACQIAIRSTTKLKVVFIIFLLKEAENRQTRVHHTLFILSRINKLQNVIAARRLPVSAGGLGKLALCSSSESSSFSFTLKQSKDVTLSDWSLHVSDQSSVDRADEADFNLCNTSSGAWTTHKAKLDTRCYESPEGRSEHLPVLPMTSSTVA